MGRPANPSLPSPGYTTRDFAPDANYGAGSDPWSGQPTKVEPPGAASSGFVPNTGAGAQFFNKLLRDGFTQQSDSKTYDTSLRNTAQTTLQDLVDYLAQGPALDFNAVASGGLAGSKRIEFIPSTLQWIAFGPTSSGTVTAIRTRDRRVWPTSNEIGAGAQIAGYNGVAAVDASANIVMPGSGATDGDKVTEYNGTTWAKHAGVFATAYVSPDVRFDVTSSLWCVCGKKFGVNAVQVHTSPDRVTWTLRTPPTFLFDAAIGPYATLASNGAGTLIMKGLYNPSTGGSAANNVAQFSRSTDGGVTWSAPVSYAAAFANSLAVGNGYYDERPIWTGTVWISCESNDTDLKSYVFKSTDDGVSWSNVATLTTVSIRAIAALGKLLVALCKTSATTGRIIFSIDDGATWYYADEQLSQSGVYVYQGAGRFVTISGASICFGAGSGMGVKAVT